MNQRFIVFLFIIFWKCTLGDQGMPHKHHKPQSNPGYHFTRSLMVDCTDKIILDISNGNVFGLEQQLIDYIGENYFGYIILCDLETSDVFTNSISSNSLRLLLTDLRKAFHGIKIGLAGNFEAPFIDSGNFSFASQFSASDLPIGNLYNMNDINDAFNNQDINSEDLAKAELVRFFFRAAQFGGGTMLQNEYSKSKYSFDAFYLSYRYWNFTSSLQTMQYEFQKFNTVLSVMQLIRKKWKFISVDTEFIPTDIFKLQGWTSIDQITATDPLANRLIIPAFNSDPTTTFNQVCKLLHYLSDRFSKPNSKIFIELSAESNAFSYCNSLSQPNNYLGDYLNGSIQPSGNMYSAEKLFLDKFNDSTYMCPLCSCRSYNDNHYSLLNPSGNSLMGIIWTPYTMLATHNLYRKPKYEISISDKKLITIEIIDLTGQSVWRLKSEEELDEYLNVFLKEGVYLKRKIFGDGSFTVDKILIMSK